jgi:hypothetical protein
MSSFTCLEKLERKSQRRADQKCRSLGNQLMSASCTRYRDQGTYFGFRVSIAESLRFQVVQLVDRRNTVLSKTLPIDSGADIAAQVASCYTEVADIHTRESVATVVFAKWTQTAGLP